MGVRICASCGLEKTRIFSHWGKNVQQNYRRFTDGAGRFWCSSVCPDCKSSRHNAWRRNSGRSSCMDKITSSSHQKGRRAERIAQAVLTNLGYGPALLNSEMHGPDLQWFLHGKFFNVEVKQAVRKKGRPNTWYVGAVKPRRRKDDMVAIVFPEKIVISGMQEHLDRCCADGSRYVSKLKGAHYVQRDST